MRGGKRPGAGRKPGALTNRNREIAEKAAQQGITPLEVLLEHMRWAHRQAVKARKSDDALLAVEAAGVAVNAAEKAAPYIHPRLSSVDSTVTATIDRVGADLSDDELQRVIASGSGEGAAFAPKSER